MRRIILIIVLFSFSFPSFSAKLDKGFEALEMFNYFEAKKIFEKNFKKKIVGASFGLCKVYDAEKSPFFDVDTAFKFILICDSAFLVATDKEKEKLKELSIDSLSIVREKVHLASFFFTRAAEINTLIAYEDFIENHPLATEFDEALKLRDHAAYLLAVKANTIDDWNYFLNTYPDASDYPSAKKELQILEYKVMTQKGDAESFRLFVAKYPDNPYTHDAQDMVYEMYTQDRKLESYEKFIKENPKNKNVEKAWNQIYKIRISKFESPQIYEFMIDYPSFPNKKMLREDLQLSMLTFYPAEKDGLWGYVDTTGNWLITPKYEWASQFSEGKALVGFVGKSVFIDKHGALMFKHLFDDAEGFKNRLSIVEVDEQYGVINFLGDTIIPIIYDELGEYSNHLIYAGLNEKYGYFNTAGELVIPFEFNNAFDFEGNIAIVTSDSGYGVINDSGRVIVPLKYETVIPDSQFCIVKNQIKYGILTYEGDTLVPFIYDVIGKFHNNRAIAANGNSYNYLNPNGEIAIKETFVFNDVSLNYSRFIDGYARVIVKGKVGIIDTIGDRKFPAIFTNVGAYKQNLTAVNKGKRWGYANRKVKLEIPYEYHFANDFEYGVAVVENDTSQGLINENNEFIIPFGMRKITRIDSTYFDVELNSRQHGIVNIDGDTIVSFSYTSIEQVTPDVLMLHKENTMFLYWILHTKFIYKEEND